MPELFEVIVNPADGFEHLPAPEVPYYVVAKEGPFLYKRTQIGDALLKESKPPKTLGAIGYNDGVFMWKGEPIPGAIISQAHDFFRRIYVKHHAEAEVLITKHNDTDAYRLFVPYQRVSHGGVKSIYEPSHVDRNYTVVGTLHSHCDFSAFHSGTDSGDASDMDGVHFTIGAVLHTPPEIVAMVAMNGQEFHYKDPSVIAEIEYETATAPPWWDTYVFAADDAPKDKPKSLVSLTQEHWEEFLGRSLFKAKAVVPWSSTSSKWTPSAPGSQYSRSIPTTGYHSDGYRPYSSSEWNQQEWLEKWRAGNGGYTAKDRNSRWEPKSKHIAEAIQLAEEFGLLTADDWDFISDADDIESPAFWTTYFANRMDNLREVMEVISPKPRRRLRK